ncbi:helix-turn-helix domain-containing protein [Bacillus thuringiensis]|uniref:helix-turn-helix domain-containing protein n=1 Tax=Bacillus thuringiensis TaxID=1428 RepID=UPI0026AE2BDE
MSITDRIKELCLNRGISVTKLEEELDFGQNTIISGKKRTPSVERVQKVADYFDVSIDFLLGRTNQMNKINFKRRWKALPKKIKKTSEKEWKR